MTHQEEHKKYVPLGRTSTEALYARVRGGTTLYVHNDHEPIGYARLEYTPRRVQRTINDFLDDPPGNG